eukprot:TRINITY_DN14785_c0_g1_i4.p1 TRINITY_DN14785_c0_g1~~TRINITY_DN14785_c0_g1_i4.p1  ORF type:complete len:261 (+),score=94.21 TRINITY_DN14785_c0_g1_i4:181-963(+)
MAPVSQLTAVTEGKDSPRAKLAQLNDRFQGFERQLEQEVKSKKDIEDTQINAIRDNITRLEKTLNSEIRRRVEANKALQAMFDAQMATVQDKLEAGLLDRIDNLQVSIVSMNDRMDAVEKYFSQSREQYVKDIDEKSQLIAKDAQLLEQVFQGERKDRREREAGILAKLKDLDGAMEARIDDAQKQIETMHGELHSDLDSAMREDSDKRFQDYLLEELAALKNGLVLEGQQREQADDEIVQALNHYTQAIQQALRVVNQA